MPHLRPRGANGSSGVLEWTVVVLLVASSVSLAGVVAEYLVGGHARTWLADAAWTVGALVAVIGVRAARRRAAPGDRSGWGLLLGACGAWLAGQIFWDVYSATSFAGSPSPADACWLAFAVAGAAGVHRLSVDRSRSRLVSWLEVAPLMVAVCALLTALLWSDIGMSSLSVAGKVTSLAYPVVYVCAAMVMAQSVLGGAVDVRHNPGIGVLLGGLVLEALAFTLWSPQLLDGTYAAGTNAVDALWTAGLLLIGLGSWAAGPAVGVKDLEQVSRRRGGILPSMTFGALISVQVAFAAGDAARGADVALSLGVSFVGITLIARASVLRREQASLLAQLHARERDLAEANRRLSEESRLDALTGLANRLRLREDFADLAPRLERRQPGYCVVLCDLDRFKDYNDALGHQAGDRVLRQVAALLTQDAREHDRVYRYGGEELLLVLREQDMEAGFAVAERRRADVERAAMPHPRNHPAAVVTFSAGVAAAQPGETPEEVLHRADRALYEAKAQGRNRIAVAGLRESRTAALAG